MARYVRTYQGNNGFIAWDHIDGVTVEATYETHLHLPMGQDDKDVFNSLEPGETKLVKRGFRDHGYEYYRAY